MKNLNLKINQFTVAAAISCVLGSVDVVNAVTIDTANLFHNNLHNFYFNNSNSSLPTFLVTDTHAAAMSYDTVLWDLSKTLPGDLNNLNRVLQHNAYYAPLTIRFTDHTVEYPNTYANINNISSINPARKIWQTVAMNNSDIELMKAYGCAQSINYTNISTNSTQADAYQLFYYDSEFNRLIVNWQSKFVVQDLASKTINSMKTQKYDHLFIDDVPRTMANKNCVNQNYGNQGTYATWKDGQLAFLQLVTNALHTMNGRTGKPIKVFANIWSPYADVYSPMWYASNQLRFDNYYFESGGFDPADIRNGGQKANSTDPETGLPAFRRSSGYLPANRVQLSTPISHFNAVVTSTPLDPKLFANYLSDHFLASGTAASQGSWFGWYGVTSVEQTNSQGVLIHNNAMQLLRSLPNWDNLAQVPLTNRKFDAINNVYSSTISSFSNHVIKGLNPINNELYLVFLDNTGKIDISGQKIVSAKFVDALFNLTKEDALSCLTQSNNVLTLNCADHIGRGIRITVQ